MIDAICSEIMLRKSEISTPLETIYFGGGTPSLLDPSHFENIWKTIQSEFDLSQLKEFTLEANPDDIDVNALQTWKEFGINRLSIGIQSFDQFDLNWMNRAHSAEEAIQSVLLAHQYGFDNVSIDLIYGLPNMDLERWEAQLNQAMQLPISHISAYCLTVEEKTALHTAVKRGTIIPASNAIQAAHFELMLHVFSQHGFEQYEISNFAKNKRYAVHNSAYWLGENYIGIGPSAHSFDGKRRAWNIANNVIYMKEIEKGILPLEQEYLSPKDQFNELVLTGLRTIWGVELQHLSEIHPIPNEFNSCVDFYQKSNHLKLENGKLLLTEQGRLLADKITSDLFLID